MNQKARTFENYEVFWEEERGEIDFWQKLQTNYDFKEANKATQKAIGQMKSSDPSSNKDDDDDWGGPSMNPSETKSGKEGSSSSSDH
jgi:hypothetical protein